MKGDRVLIIGGKYKGKIGIVDLPLIEFGHGNVGINFGDKLYVGIEIKHLEPYDLIGTKGMF